MPTRATRRGADRTPLDRDADVLVCGASFAGLAVARELRATGADVLVVDRYEIGERQTSACAAPTSWLTALGLGDAILQSFSSMVVHTPTQTVRMPLPWTWSTFDYRDLCERLWRQCGPAGFETAKVDGITRRPRAHAVHTDRGDLRAPLVVDALGWRRVLGDGAAIQPPRAALSRGLEVHPPGVGEDMELWIDRGLIRAGYGWSFPAGREVRVGIGSFDPADHVKVPTVSLAGALGREPDGYQGNWIPHRMRPAADGAVFFVGDSAGHCLPLSAEGIRFALYFGIVCGRELRAVLEGRQHRSTALRRYREAAAEHEWHFEQVWRLQRAVPRLPPRLLDALVRACARPDRSRRLWERYGRLAPAELALPAPPEAPRRAVRAAA